MKLIPTLLGMAGLLFAVAGVAADKDTRVFELRTYHAAPGKLADLNARFRDHTLRIFEKHGMTNLGYWTPATNTDNLLIYLLAFPNRAAQQQAWRDFGADPEWQAAQKASEVNGKLVSRVESVLLTATDYSPLTKPETAGTPRVFELRTYHAQTGKLDELNARFRDHTKALFTKHGMDQFGYWLPTEAKDGAGETLIYILAHKSREAADASWTAFRADPDWVTAKAASEVNGSLTVTNGVKSVFMTPTDYSPTK